MKNIITIILILILPVLVYFGLSKNSETTSANAELPNKPTIMIFSSTMCYDCKKLKLVLNEIEPLYSEKVNFVHFDALKNDKKIKKYIKDYNIMLTPTTIILDKNNENFKKIEGYIIKENLINEIEALING